MRDSYRILLDTPNTYISARVVSRCVQNWWDRLSEVRFLLVFSSYWLHKTIMRRKLSFVVAECLIDKGCTINTSTRWLRRRDPGLIRRILVVGCQATARLNFLIGFEWICQSAVIRSKTGLSHWIRHGFRKAHDLCLVGNAGIVGISWHRRQHWGILLFGLSWGWLHLWFFKSIWNLKFIDLFFYLIIICKI